MEDWGLVMVDAAAFYVLLDQVVDLAPVVLAPRVAGWQVGLWPRLGWRRSGGGGDVLLGRGRFAVRVRACGLLVEFVERGLVGRFQLRLALHLDRGRLV